MKITKIILTILFVGLFVDDAVGVVVLLACQGDMLAAPCPPLAPAGAAPPAVAMFRARPYS